MEIVHERAVESSMKYWLVDGGANQPYSLLHYKSEGYCSVLGLPGYIGRKS